MKDIKIPFLPSLDFLGAQDKAEKFLSEHNFLNTRSNQVLPINVEILAHRSGHPVEVIAGLQKEFGIKGTAYKNLTKKCLEIYIDADHYNYESNSYPFTIAEELSHIILHQKVFEQIETAEDRLALEENSTQSNHQYIEMQAKRLASELLLPTSAFTDYIDGWTQKNLQTIKDDRPVNESDLADFIARKTWSKLGLSEAIIKRALLRNFDIKIIKNIVDKYGIKYLS